MTNVTNLNRFRKSRTRSERQKQAEENRVRFGRTKAEKLISEARKTTAENHLDGHKLEKDDE